jgi:hypothetical protein
MHKPKVISLLALSFVAVAAQAQEGLPKRKPGLWEVTMQMRGAEAAGMPATNSQQCVDDKTDEAMQRKGMSGDGQADCRQTGFKKIAGGFETSAECRSAEGLATVNSRVTGDMGSRYAIDNTVMFSPPRHGMSEVRMQGTAQHGGACPAGMKPGDVRMGGMPANTMQGMNPEQMQNMSPADRQKMIEQMMKTMPQGGAKP